MPIAGNHHFSNPEAAMHRLLCVLFICVVEVSGQDPDSLFSSIRRNDVTAVQALLTKGIDVNTRNRDSATALMYASVHADVPIMKLLLANQADVNARNPVGATALMWAAGDLAKVQLLVQSGADVNARSESGRTSLIVAANYAGNVETVRFLLANRADPKIVDRNGDGPVGSAVTAGDSAVLRELLARGANIRELVRAGGNFYGYTPLMRAAQARCVECVRILLEAGADVDHASDDPATVQAGRQASGNFTALLLAAPHANTELLRSLLG